MFRRGCGRFSNKLDRGSEEEKWNGFVFLV